MNLRQFDLRIRFVDRNGRHDPIPILRTLGQAENLAEAVAVGLRWHYAVELTNAAPVRTIQGR